MKPNIPEDLKRVILEIDGWGYKAYKRLQGRSYDFAPFLVTFEHVQGDAYAPPSRISVTVDLAAAGFADESLSDSSVRQLAFEDFLLRSVHRRVESLQARVRGTGKSGLIDVLAPSQKILKRNALLVAAGKIRLIMFAGLPADGRRVSGRECLSMFAETLPTLWAESLLAPPVDRDALQQHIHTLEDYEALRGLLAEKGWVAFVANDSLLPRASGISDRPLETGGVRFAAPEGLTDAVELPHRGTVEGMPVPRGVTLIVGGGFHGKSTLLAALQSAVYPHIPGDGRETVATAPGAVKIRAEDGRAAHGVDISGFMDRLPGIRSTKTFSTQSASGSTSQAVNIIEALESGADLLLMDEDTCAANFMIRDARMQKLIHADKEPITPYLDRIGEIGRAASSILVMGGSGDYFEAADRVIAMEWFRPRLVTRQAKAIAGEFPSGRRKEIRTDFPPVKPRRIDPQRLTFDRGNKECVIKTNGLVTLTLGRNEIDTRYIEQLAEEGQLEACGWIMRKLKTVLRQNELANRAGIEAVYRELEERGIDTLTPFNTGRLALPRIQEVMAALNRLR
ncbi:MAG: ABC-ATPase domain-containing protein [Nitrospinales bacterium]